MQLKVEVDSLERMFGMVTEVAFEMFSFFIFCILRISFSKWYSYTCNVRCPKLISQFCVLVRNRKKKREKKKKTPDVVSYMEKMLGN
jgi:hypothetical protein